MLVHQRVPFSGLDWRNKIMYLVYCCYYRTFLKHDSIKMWNRHYFSNTTMCALRVQHAMVRCTCQLRPRNPTPQPTVQNPSPPNRVTRDVTSAPHHERSEVPSTSHMRKEKTPSSTNGKWVGLGAGGCGMDIWDPKYPNPPGPKAPIYPLVDNLDK